MTSIHDLAAIALTSDDAPAWRRIGAAALVSADRRHAAVGTELALLAGIHALPPDALAALQGTPERAPMDASVLEQSLVDALALLARLWPSAEREVRYFVRAVVACTLPPGRQASGSSELCPFAVRVDFCAGDPSHLLADALVHEAAHVKLRLSGIAKDLCVHDDPHTLHHPWRPEARPIVAVLVACHAFVAIHGFHVRRALLIGSDDALRFEARLRAEVAEALAALGSAEDRLTELGRAFTVLLEKGFARNRALLDEQLAIESLP